MTVDGEDEALDDLPDVDADRRGGVGGGLRAVREAHRADVEPGRRGGGDDPADVGVDVGLVAHEAGTVAGPADASTRDPVNEQAAATR